MFLRDLILRQTTSVYFGLLRTFQSSGCLYGLSSRHVPSVHAPLFPRRGFVSAPGLGRLFSGQVTEGADAPWTSGRCRDELIDARRATRDRPRRAPLGLSPSLDPSGPRTAWPDLTSHLKGGPSSALTRAHHPILLFIAYLHRRVSLMYLCYRATLSKLLAGLRNKTPRSNPPE